MNTRLTLFLAAAGGFLGGFLAGTLAAPQSGRATRRRLAASARGSTDWLESQLHAFETQLEEVEQQISEAGSQLGDRVRTATQDAVDQYLPSMPDDASAWAIERDDVAQDLRHLPRR